MRRFPCGVAAVGLVVLAVAGCGGTTKPVKTYTMAQPLRPLDELRALLEGYAGGQPVGSEATGFAGLVGRIREVDPQRAGMVEEGLAEIVHSPATAAARARRMLEKLGGGSRDGEPASRP